MRTAKAAKVQVRQLEGLGYFAMLLDYCPRQARLDDAHSSRAVYFSSALAEVERRVPLLLGASGHRGAVEFVRFEGTTNESASSEGPE